MERLTSFFSIGKTSDQVEPQLEINNSIKDAFRLIALNYLSVRDHASLRLVCKAINNKIGQLWLQRTQIQQIFSGDEHLILILNDGTVMGMGSNHLGQLGVGSVQSINQISFLSQGLPYNTRVFDAATGDNHTLLLLADGRLIGTGSNTQGQLALGHVENQQRYIRINSPDDSPVQRIWAKGNTTVILTELGNLFGAGCSEFGQFGNNTTAMVNADFINLSANIQHDSPICDVALGSKNLMILFQDGSILAAGDNEFGQLATGDQLNKSVFTQSGVGLPENFKINQLSMGDGYTLALSESGEVKIAGLNSPGSESSDSTKFDRYFYIDDQVTHLTAGNTRHLFITQQQQLFASGMSDSCYESSFGISSIYSPGGTSRTRDNLHMQLVNDGLLKLCKVTKIVDQAHHFLILTADGSIFYSGYSEHGLVKNKTREKPISLDRAWAVYPLILSTQMKHKAAMLKSTLTESNLSRLHLNQLPAALKILLTNQHLIRKLSEHDQINLALQINNAIEHGTVNQQLKKCQKKNINLKSDLEMIDEASIRSFLQNG